METKENKQTSRGRQGLVATLSASFVLLALVFSISLASTRHEIAGQRPSTVAAASVETQTESITSEPVKPALTWAGASRENITQRRLPGHSECDLQLD